MLPCFSICLFELIFGRNHVFLPLVHSIQNSHQETFSFYDTFLSADNLVKSGDIFLSVEIFHRLAIPTKMKLSPDFEISADIFYRLELSPGGNQALIPGKSTQNK